MVYLRVYLDKSLSLSYNVTCICERKVARDYYYIEIVKGYLCLALNRHIVFIRMGTQRCCENLKACDVCELED